MDKYYKFEVAGSYVMGHYKNPGTGEEHAEPICNAVDSEKAQAVATALNESLPLKMKR